MVLSSAERIMPRRAAGVMTAATRRGVEAAPAAVYTRAVQR